MIIATHIIKPEGAYSVEVSASGTITTWYLNTGGNFKMASSPKFKTLRESVEFHNSNHSNARGEYDYE